MYGTYMYVRRGRYRAAYPSEQTLSPACTSTAVLTFRRVPRYVCVTAAVAVAVAVAVVLHTTRRVNAHVR